MSFRLLVNLSILFALPCVAEDAPALRLDAEGCVARALAQSGRVLAAEADVEAAQAGVGQAKARQRPVVKAQAGAVYIEGQQGAAPGGLGTILGVGGVTPSDKVGLAAVQLQQTLYAGGRIRAGIEASQYLADSEAWRADAVRADVVLQTRQAFHDTRLAEALVAVAEAAVQTFEAHLADVRQLEENGVVSRFERLRAETELKARKADLTSAETLLDVATANLCRLMGLPPETGLALTGGVIPEAPQARDQLEADALVHRAELKALDAAIKAAQANIRAERGAYRPSAGVLVQYQEVDGGGAILPDGLVAGVGAQWTWYAGGQRKHKVLEARARTRSLEHQRTELERLVRFDVFRAHAAVGEALAKIELEKKAVDTATEGLRLARLRFREGAGTQTEVLDAELAHTQAQSSLARAERDHAVALATLDRAVGVNVPAVE